MSPKEPAAPPEVALLPEIDTSLPLRAIIDLRYKHALGIAGGLKDLTALLVAAGKWEEIKHELDGGAPQAPEAAPGSALGGEDDEE